MSRFPSSSLVLFAFGLTACGGIGSVCKRYEDIFAGCINAEDADTCKEDGKECTGDDIDKMNAYLDCWEDEGFTCGEDLTTDEFDVAAACSAELEDVSAACAGT